MHAGHEYMVLYKYVDGAHLFTSLDPRIKGVLVMHADPKVAFNEVTSQINYLLKKDGAGVECKPALSFTDFKKWLTNQLDREETPIQTVPAARIRFRFEDKIAA